MQNKEAPWYLSKKSAAALAAAAVLTAAICLVMNLLLIPAIESGAAGLRCFDMRFGYSAAEARAFLGALSDEARSTYLRIQLPLDFLYPLCYCAFFSLALLRLNRQKTPLALLPLLLAFFDYGENLCVLFMLRALEPDVRLIAAGSGFTRGKTVLMYGVFTLLLVFFVRRLVQKRRK